MAKDFGGIWDQNLGAQIKYGSRIDSTKTGSGPELFLSRSRIRPKRPDPQLDPVPSQPSKGLVLILDGNS